MHDGRGINSLNSSGLGFGDCGMVPGLGCFYQRRRVARFGEVM